MTPPVLQKITFDNSRPFRRSPWLYAMVGLVALGIVVLLVVVAWFSLSDDRVLRQPSGPIETSGEKSNRLAIMNALNAFHLQESAVAKTASTEDKLEAKKEHVGEVIQKLEAVKTEASMQSAQNDLLQVFGAWEAKLRAGASGEELKSDFVSIAQKYPWLNTLVWIIILNRL